LLMNQALNGYANKEALYTDADLAFKILKKIQDTFLSESK